MPLIGSFGAGSREGFKSSKINEKYFIGYYDSSNSQGLSVIPSSTKGSYVGLYYGGFPGVIKLSSTGVLESAYQLQLSTSAWGGYVYGIVEDSNKNVYITGDISNGTLYKVFLCKYNSSGVIVWQILSSYTYTSSSSGIVIDSSGNIFICGSIWEYNNYRKGFVTKFNSSGTQLWTSSYTYVTGGGANYFQNTSLCLDSSGNIFVVGSGQGTFAYIVKYNTSGTVQFNYQFQITTGANTTFDKINIDSSNNIYLMGDNYFGATPGYSPIIVKLNSSNVVQWVIKLETTKCSGPYRSCIDTLGNTYCFYAAGASTIKDLYLVKINSTGSVEWSRKFTITSTNNNSGLSANDINIDSFGILYLSGLVYLPTASDYRAFYMKLPSDGSKTGSYTFGSVTISYQSTSVSGSSISGYTYTSVGMSTGAAMTMSSSSLTLYSPSVSTNYNLSI